jgi:hypothetical protein
MFEEQLVRINKKLKEAGSVDSDQKVFGASSHKYKVNEPISNSAIERFESKYHVKLPLSYKEFLLNIGNGGAGPFYGIYPLGHRIDELAEKAGEFLCSPALIEPGISDNEWRELTQRIKNDDDISDDEFDQVVAKIYSGILPIGTQGCTYLHAIVVTGKHAGQVVNVDMDLNKPSICYEKNFLDWYERWLDEVISGILISDNPTWFGYLMGGNDNKLLNLFDKSADFNVKLDALLGLQKLHSISKNSCDRLQLVCSRECGEIKRVAAQLLVKFSYQESKKAIEELIESDDVDFKTACQAVFWYQKEHSRQWAPAIASRIRSVKSPETFQFAMYLLHEAKFDFGDVLVPFYRSESEEIRVTSYHSLGLLKRKSDYIDQFAAGLKDESPRVVHTVLQALSGIKSDELVDDYLGILKRFKTDEYYILTNLDHRLKELGYKKRSKFIAKHNKSKRPNKNNNKNMIKKISALFK